MERIGIGYDTVRARPGRISTPHVLDALRKLGNRPIHERVEQPVPPTFPGTMGSEEAATQAPEQDETDVVRRHAVSTKIPHLIDVYG